jgi:hypothetical protein
MAYRNVTLAGQNDWQKFSRFTNTEKYALQVQNNIELGEIGTFLY